MKGTVHKCFEKMITERFGLEKWQECLTKVGIDEDHVFMINDDVDEGKTMEFLMAAPGVLGISLPELVDHFSDYWVFSYAPKVYPAYFTGITSAKQFMLGLDNLHIDVTNTIPNAKPPRFKYSWINENTLEMEYMSSRGMVDLFISMGKAIGRYYKNTVIIDKKENNKVHFTFA